jgi:hypothetical protein
MRSRALEGVTTSGRRSVSIDPKDGQPRGFAFVWRRFEISDLPAPMLACVMATVRGRCNTSDG